MIGDRIREMREARAWTQAHLADAAGLSLRTVQRLESLHSCSAETMLALASALEVDVRMLAEERTTRPAWRGPSVKAAAWWGALLAAPCLAFVLIGLLKYELGVDAPWDQLAALGYALGIAKAFAVASPLLLPAGALAAVLLNFFTLVRPRLRRDGPGAAVVAIDLRFSAASLTVLLVAGTALSLVTAHFALVLIGDVARAAV